MATALTSLALGAVGERKREVKEPLVRVRTIFQRGEAPEILEVEANLDPLEVFKALGFGIVVGGVALAAGWILWDGLAAPTPFGSIQIFNGLKTNATAREEADRLQGSLKTRRQCTDLRTGYRKLLAVASAETDPASKASILAEAEKFKEAAANLGCRWAR